MEVSPRARRQGIYYGWWMVLAGLISSSYLHASFAYGFSALFNPIVGAFGWSRATVAVAFSLQRGEAAVAAPIVGYLVDRYGPRPLLVIGAALIAVGFVSLSFTSNLFNFYLSFIIIAVGTSVGFLLPNTVAINIWFNQYRSRALAILSMGSGIGGVATPLIVWLIEALTWRGALRILAAGVLLVCIPTALFIRHYPEDYGLEPDGRPPDNEGSTEDKPKVKRTSKRMYTLQALRSRVFWQLSIGISLGFTMASVFVVFSIPAFQSRGLTAGEAGLAVTGAVLTSLIGRTISGFLGDRLDKRNVLCMGIVILFLGSVIFAFPGDGLLPIVGLSVCYGMGQGLLTPVRFAIVADFFGRDAYGELSGLMNTVSAFFSVLAPIVVGKWADATGGDYRMPFLFFGLTCLAALPVIATLKYPDHRIGD